MVRRFVLTGAPGSGKSTLLRALHERGHHVVAEAATDVIAEGHAAGRPEPWERDDFIDLIVALQRHRQCRPVDRAIPAQVFDRSPLCTLALARWLRRPVTPLLAEEVARVLREQVYEQEVFLVRPLGFVEPTAACRISFEDSLLFEAVHEAVYGEHGFNLVDVPAGPLTDRLAVIEAYLSAPVHAPAPCPSGAASTRSG